MYQTQPQEWYFSLHIECRVTVDIFALTNSFISHICRRLMNVSTPWNGVQHCKRCWNILFCIITVAWSACKLVGKNNEIIINWPKWWIIWLMHWLEWWIVWLIHWVEWWIVAWLVHWLEWWVVWLMLLFSLTETKTKKCNVCSSQYQALWIRLVSTEHIV